MKSQENALCSVHMIKRKGSKHPVHMFLKSYHKKVPEKRNPFQIVASAAEYGSGLYLNASV